MGTKNQLTTPVTLRKRVAECLEADSRRSALSRAIDYGLIALIFLNIAAVIAESVPELMMRHGETFHTFEAISVVVFTIEYIARIWSCPELQEPKYADGWRGRLRFALTPTALIDLLAIAPFFLSMFTGIDLRFLRALRLARALKLTRYSRNMQLILTVLQSEARAFMAAFSLMLILLILASSGIYLIEHEVQPDTFGSIPAAMWWAMATLTTVGYGDVIPITPMGKVFGGCITLIGVGMVALPAGILASSFSEQLRLHRRRWEQELATAFEDGVVDSQEMAQLDELREQLGLSETDAELLFEAFSRESHRTCPHCRSLTETFNPSRRTSPAVAR